VNSSTGIFMGHSQRGHAPCPVGGNAFWFIGHSAGWPSEIGRWWGHCKAISPVPCSEYFVHIL